LRPDQKRKKQPARKACFPKRGVSFSFASRRKPAQRDEAKRNRAEVRSQRERSKKRSGLRMTAWISCSARKACFPKRGVSFSFASRRKPAQRDEAKRNRAEVRSQRERSKKRSGLRMITWISCSARKACFPKRGVSFSFASRRKPAHEQEASGLLMTA